MHYPIDGAEALELYRTHEADIDLVISDVLMPGLSGPALYEALCRYGGAVNFIFMSGLHRGRLAGDWEAHSAQHPRAAPMGRDLED